MSSNEYVQRWQSIYEQSLDIINHVQPTVWWDRGFIGADGKATWDGLVELRTVHMGAGRQNGKTTWIRDFMVKNPKAIVVLCNSGLRNNFIDAWAVEHNESVFTRAFTIMDLVTIVNNGPKQSLAFLSETTHVIFDDASHNNAIHHSALAKAVNGLFTKETVVIRMG
jgi:hypothetical protein